MKFNKVLFIALYTLSTMAIADSPRLNLPLYGKGEVSGESRSSNLNFRENIHDSLVKSGRVALTFDDGPGKYTAKLVDILDQYNVKATFFILKKNVRTKSRRDLVIRMIQNGHIIASHTVNHANSNKLEKPVFEKEVRDSLQFVLDLYAEAGVDPYFFFRFPYAAHGLREDYHHFDSMRDVSLELLGDNCLFYSFWDQDTVDWAVGSNSKRFAITQAELESNLLAQFKPNQQLTTTEMNDQGRMYVKREVISEALKGGVVLMHDIKPKTVDSVRVFLEAHQNFKDDNPDQALEFVTLAEVQEYFLPRGNQCIANSHEEVLLD